MHLARTIVVSSFVLLSSTMLADVVLAEEGAQLIEFNCDVPLIGSLRCGSPERNVRVGGNKTLSVQVTSIPTNSCVKFTVYHAVENKELASLSGDVCGNQPATRLWINPKDEGVDVYMTVKSVGRESYKIRGRYIIE